MSLLELIVLTVGKGALLWSVVWKAESTNLLDLLALKSDQGGKLPKSMVKKTEST